LDWLMRRGVRGRESLAGKCETVGEGPHSAMASAARSRKVEKLRSPFKNAGESSGSIGAFVFREGRCVPRIEGDLAGATLIIMEDGHECTVIGGGRE